MEQEDQKQKYKTAGAFSLASIPEMRVVFDVCPIFSPSAFEPQATKAETENISLVAIGVLR